MQCPICQHPNSRVLESRSTEAGQSVRRRRECLNCQHRFTTYERIEFVPITVIKKDGSRESFDKSKLMHALIQSCEKTGVFSKEIEGMVEAIEAEIMGRSLREITSTTICELVLTRLRYLSEVAYIRYASIYLQYQGIRDFVDTLNQFSNSIEKQKQTDTPQSLPMRN